MDTLRQIEMMGILPVITLDNIDDAKPLAQALLRGGIQVAEVAFRTPVAGPGIRHMAEACPELLLGAGTILSVEQCRQALDAGAQFIVSPGYDEEVVALCQAENIPVLPGCFSPSEFTRAAAAGLTAVKVFPAELSGGMAYLKALAPIFSGLRFLPTGGINQSNLTEYLAYDRVLACGGSWMVKRELITSGDFDGITALCRQAMLSMLGFEVAHVGLNTSDGAAALAAAKKLDSLFGFAAKEGVSSVFSSSGVEIIKGIGKGQNGHIAIATNDVERAVAWLENRGVTFETDTAKCDAGGRLKAIYLRDEFCGFALHLVKKQEPGG